MDIKKIIREELEPNLLIEGRLNGLLSKFNMSEIKKLLKDRLDIDENSSKTEIAKKLVRYYYNLNLKLLKYELGAVLGGFVFYFLSMILDVAGVEPFVTTPENPNPGIPHFILWGAGALLNLIRMIKSDKKKRIKEESDDLDWISDVSANPWLVYDVILIDVKLSNEEINNLIELALNSGRKIHNSTDWTTGRDYDLSRIQKYYRENGAYLRISKEDNLVYSREVDLPRMETNKIRYSELFKNKINESEDDLDWIRDTRVIDFSEILKQNDSGKTVAIWFGDMSEEYIEYIQDFINEYGYYWKNQDVYKHLKTGKVKGITFYPGKNMGVLYNRTNWSNYLEEFEEGIYGDYPSDLVIMEL